MSNTVEDYGWQSAEGPQSCGYIGPAVLDLIKSMGAQRVVDIGAGNGSLCGMLRKSGLSAVGIEYDAAGVEVARKAYPDLKFYNLGVQDDPADIIAAEGLFDVVVSTEVVEHLFSPHLLPIFAKRLLKPGGKIIISTPYHGYLKNLALSVADKWDRHHTALWHGGHIKFWSRDTLTTLLQENGFEVERFVGVGRMPLLWKSMILIAKAK